MNTDESHLELSDPDELVSALNRCDAIQTVAGSSLGFHRPKEAHNKNFFRLNELDLHRHQQLYKPIVALQI